MVSVLLPSLLYSVKRGRGRTFAKPPALVRDDDAAGVAAPPPAAFLPLRVGACRVRKGVVSEDAE